MQHTRKMALRVATVALAATTACSASGGAGALSESGDSPATEAVKNGDGSYNILFVTTDQEHYFDQYPQGTSYKARELLAELGTTFEKHYTCANMSTSARSVIYTGQHIPQTKMLDNIDVAWQSPMSPDLTTVGDRLRQAGYYTAFKGKWHMGGSGILGLHESSLSDLEDYGFADWGGTDYIGTLYEGLNADPVISSEAVEWLEGTGKALNEQGQSFFLAVNMVNPHDIMNYDNSGAQSNLLALGGKPDDPVYQKTYADPAPSSWDFDLNAPDVPEALSIYNSEWCSYTGAVTDEAGWKDYQDYYYNCIQDNDNHLMELLDYVVDSGLLKNTIIVFTSDHGEMHGSHGLKGKGGFVYENCIHVPLYIVHPEYEGGRRISAVTSHLDLAPTFLDMTGLPDEEKERLCEGLPGHSLMDLMDGSASSVRDGALFCYESLLMSAVQVDVALDGSMSYQIDLTNRGMVRGLITEDYKFVRYFAPLEFNTPQTLEELYAMNDVQLFDLRQDPEELNNLAADPEANGELLLELNARLNRLIEEEIGQDDGQEITVILQTLQQSDLGA